MNRLRLTLAALVVALGANLASGCATGPTSYPTPASYSVSYMGTCYTGYLYDPDEALMFGVPSTCIPHVFPANPPLAGTLEWALWAHLLTYDSYYHSPYYYDHVLYPMSTRYHVTVVTRTTFVSTTRDFDTRNSRQVKSASAKAKWSNGKTGAYRFPTTNSKAATSRPLTNKGYSGTENSTNARTASGSGTSSGKSGTSSRYSGTSGGFRVSSGGRR